LSERTILAHQAKEFNASQSDIIVNVLDIDQATYNDQVQLAIVQKKLPDVFEFDGPNLQNYVYQGNLLALDSLVSPEVLKDLTPSIRAQGTRDGHLYSVGAIDSGLGLFADRRALVAAGVRIPQTSAEAWTAAEFTKVLAAVARHDSDGQVLNLSLNYGKGEWFTYAFAPVVWSAGGGLGQAPRFDDAAGTLATPAVSEALKQLRQWTVTYAVPAKVNGDAAFIAGKVPLSWGGHWDYPTYQAALGANLVLLPLPDFGFGSKTGSGTWNWGITSTSRHPAAAGRFLDFLMSKTQALSMSNVTGAPPGTASAMFDSPLYSTGSPLQLFASQLSHSCGVQPERTCSAVTRPTTPAYPVITAAFQDVMDVVFTSGDIDAALHTAATKIDADYAANHGYAAGSRTSASTGANG
jgi:multiple sugar transport system substrate-binding protein